MMFEAVAAEHTEHTIFLSPYWIGIFTLGHLSRIGLSGWNESQFGPRFAFEHYFEQCRNLLQICHHKLIRIPPAYDGHCGNFCDFSLVRAHGGAARVETSCGCGEMQAFLLCYTSTLFACIQTSMSWHVALNIQRRSLPCKTLLCTAPRHMNRFLKSPCCTKYDAAYRIQLSIPLYNPCYRWNFQAADQSGTRGLRMAPSSTCS